MGHGFLSDDAPLWVRRGYASEADYLNAQANRARDAKEQQAREANQRHAAAGRDYSIIKRINKRIRQREANRRQYWKNPEQWRAYFRVHSKIWRAKNRAHCRSYNKRWYQQNKEWALRSRAIWQSEHRVQVTAWRREWRANKRATDPKWHEQEKVKAREYRKRIAQDVTLHEQRLHRERAYYVAHRKEINTYQRDRRARKRAEKLAQQQQDGAA